MASTADPSTDTPRRVDYVRLDQVALAPRNAQGHDGPGIARAIAHHGFGELPLRDERTGRLVAGHGRHEQLVAMHGKGESAPDGITVDTDGMWLMPVIAGWSSRSDPDAEAYLVGSNQLTRKGGVDEHTMADILTDLADANLLELTGYEQSDLDDMIAALQDDVEQLPAAPLNDPDDVPEATRQPFTETGDVWHLGPHRLAVGDSTDVDVWDRLLGGDKADMVWTDPPYGVGYQVNLTPEEAKRLHRRTDGLTVENDTLDEDGLADFLRAAFAAIFTATRPGACWYVSTPPGPLHLAFGNALHELGVLRQTLIWAKDQFVMGRSDYHYKHESVYYGWTPGAAHHPVPDRTQDSVHECDRPKANKDHPTMKPVALIGRHIENSTDPGQLVIDGFGGSGSTLIACHTTGRKAAVVELDRKYADVICRRYQEHTGTVPTRDGVPHDFTTDSDG